MFCPNCGQQLKNGKCSKCGFILQGQNNEKTKKASKGLSKVSKFVLDVILGILVFISFFAYPIGAKVFLMLLFGIPFGLLNYNLLFRKDKTEEEKSAVITGSEQKNITEAIPSPNIYRPNTAPAPDREAIAKAKERLNKYVVFDLETTGLHPRKNEIVEIGAVKVENGVIVDTFSTLVKPRKEITAEVTEINGITNEMLADAPSINRVLPDFKKFIGSCTLVAHNAEFDCKFLYVAFARFKMKLTNKYVDTLEMARKAYPRLNDHKLGTLCGYLNIENETAHRALSDTLATQQLFTRLADLTPAAAHKIKPVSNIRVFDTRLSDSTRNIKELTELIEELSKGAVLTDRDLSRLTDWLTAHSDQRDEYPASRLPAIMKLTDSEQLRSELKALTEISFTKDYEKLIDISDRTVALDGEFRSGSFEEVSKMLSDKGAEVKSRALKKADYFVIGEFGSPDWAFGNYGTGYKTMMEYIDAGSKTVIISERDFFKALKK